MRFSILPAGARHSSRFRCRSSPGARAAWRMAVQHRELVTPACLVLLEDRASCVERCGSASRAFSGCLSVAFPRRCAFQHVHVGGQLLLEVEEERARAHGPPGRQASAGDAGALSSMYSLMCDSYRMVARRGWAPRCRVHPSVSSGLAEQVHIADLRNPCLFRTAQETAAVGVGAGGPR